jgi:2-amino-4-hydroxy-6-hydroxymethyldihydropteridine diphosphokinase
LYISNAIEYIKEAIGEVLKCSYLYETEPWGFDDETFFLNQVIKIETKLLPNQILEKIHILETQMGRVRTNVRYSARPIDVDILFYDNDIIDEPELIIPHKEITNRRFVLVPLVDVAANYIHPVLQKKVSQLLLECPDKSQVYKFDPLKGR